MEPRRPPPYAKAALKIIAIAGVALFVTVLVASIRQSPGIGGVLSGLFLGLFATLLFFGAIAAAAMWWLGGGNKVADPIDPAAAEELARPLAPVLDELERTRRDIVAMINRRAIWRVPLCAAGAIVFTLYDPHGEGLDVFSLVTNTAAGGFSGYVWSSFKLGEGYRRMYKDRVLPVLAARFGAITYRAAVMPDMGRLRHERIFREFDSATAEDELVGTYRGLDIDIVELILHIDSGDKRRICFDGLLVEVVLPRALVGTTAVVADGGAFGNFRDWMARDGRDRIRLEDPRFEKYYEVWGTDQISARALLTPAFMERFLALADLPGFGRPLALARDNRLTLALPKSGGERYFEPPSYHKPAASREALVRLDRDISAVLKAADAVIDLDHSGQRLGADA